MAAWSRYEVDDYTSPEAATTTQLAEAVQLASSTSDPQRAAELDSWISRASTRIGEESETLQLRALRATD